MCGIAGFVEQTEAASRDTLAAMVERLRHRGPDACGLFVQDNVALGHARLSIIDLDQGGQPMRYDGRRYVITYNGEVYNFPELKAELETADYRFRTTCDTEVVLAAYIHWGTACLEKFNGMFSLAIWDGVNHKLFMARDRLGQKPLYYACLPGTFLFASEIKAILAHPRARAVLNRNALVRYLTFEYVPAPDSILAGIHKLPAGHSLLVDTDDLHMSPPQPYWECRYESRSIAADEARERLAALLEQSVARHLIADVPVGVFLSGGVDSSLLVALASRRVKDLRTFSVHFREKSFDESDYSTLVARLFHTDHHTQTFTSETLYSVLPDIVDKIDEPLADPSILPTYLLSRFTRNSVKVALGGDGGDELFAGYDPFLALAPANWWRRLPMFVRHAVRRLAACLPVSETNVSLDFKINRFLLGADAPPEIRLAMWMGAFPPAALADLLAPDFAAGLCLEPDYVLSPCLSQMRQMPARECAGVAGALRFYARLYLGDDILTKVDRASMMHSLEVRAPFLDSKLVEFVHGLPHHYKLRGFTRKYLLKQVAAGLLPHSVVYRRKKGFGVPVAAWLKRDLAPLLDRYLRPEVLVRQNIFRPAYVQRLIAQHQNGVANHAKALWALLMFAQWAERWCPQS